MGRTAARTACVSLLMLACISVGAAGLPIELTLQTRAGKTDGIVTRKEPADPAKIGVVIIDMWNTNDCMTNAQRAAALVPRMNKALEAARHLGMQIIWAPTDVASQYVGTPQRERAIALPREPLPHIANFSCPFSVGTVRPDKCMCGPGIVCHIHYGWDQMDPNLAIGDGDWIVGDPEELYAIYKQRGLTRLIYMGINTNLCVMNKPEGIAPMTSAGLKCVLARDLTDAETLYDPEHAFTPDIGTDKDVADIERSGIPSISMLDEMRRAGAWNDKWVVEKVRMAPWGTETWPYLFTNSVKVTLTTHEQKGAEIRYTLDSGEPSAASPLYTKPLDVTKTTHLRAAAFQNGHLVTLVSDGEFIHLGSLPPKPNVYLDQLKPVTPALRPNWRWEPKINQAFTGAPLSIRDATYSKGIGMRAPANLLYKIQPGYDRFVARAGVDDAPYRERPNAQFLATYPSARFKIYIDGNLASESPVMRLSQEPWRFDVRIPVNSRLINLVVTGVGSHSPFDLANWVDAGFVLKR
jgi:NPCBM/NEW2 domain/Chitobiase/beta-hexosaminidase C-terminal domain